MKNTLISLLLNFFSTPLESFRNYRKSTVELARLKIALLYVKSIETFRLLFLSLLGVGVCLFFLLGSMVLFHAVLFNYTPWSTTTKMYLGFFLSLVYFLLAVSAFYYVFSQTKWLKIFYADDIVKKLSEMGLDKEKDAAASFRSEREEQKVEETQHL
jgi:hypothetical protein